MSLPIFELAWDGSNVEHLWQSHQVAPDEVEEAILGLEGDPPDTSAGAMVTHMSSTGKPGAGGS